MALRSPVVDPDRRNQKGSRAPRYRPRRAVPTTYRSRRDYSWLEPYQKHMFILNIIGLGMALIFLTDSFLTVSRQREHIESVMANYYYDSEGVKRLKDNDIIITREGSRLPVDVKVGKMAMDLQGYQIMVYRTGLLSRPYKFRFEGYQNFYPCGKPLAPLIAFSVFLGISAFLGLTQKTSIENKFGNSVATLILIIISYFLLR